MELNDTPLSTQTRDELWGKARHVLLADWHIHYALFACSGFTEPLQVQAEREGELLVGLEGII